MEQLITTLQELHMEAHLTRQQEPKRRLEVALDSPEMLDRLKRIVDTDTGLNWYYALDMSPLTGIGFREFEVVYLTERDIENGVYERYIKEGWMIKLEGGSWKCV